MRQCQFCGCHTNAYRRRCCARGETEDERPADPSTERKPCPRWCGWEHPGHANDPHPPKGASFFIVPDGPINRARCANERHDFNPKPASPSTELQFCGRQITASPLHVCGGSIVSRELGVTRIQCGRCRLGRPPLPQPSPLTVAPACGCGRLMRMSSPDHPIYCGTFMGGNLEYCSSDCRSGVPDAPPIERCSCAESIDLRRRLETAVQLLRDFAEMPYAAEVADLLTKERT